MDSVYKENPSSYPPAFPASPSYGYAQDAVDWSNFDPTTMGPYFYYYVSESLRLVIQYAGLTPNPSNLNQLNQAIRIIANAPSS